MGELCAWCKNREAETYARYEGCCSLHCRDLMECDKELAQKEAELSRMRMENSVLMDVIKIPFSANKKPELSLAKKWEMSLSLMKDMITELYGDETIVDEPDAKARIRELEGFMLKIIQTYPIDALGLTVDARMREIAREALSEKSDKEDADGKS